MFSRSLLAVGLFLQMSVSLCAQFVQNPMGQMTPTQQRRVMEQMQRQNMQQQMQQNMQAQQQGMQGSGPFEATGTIDTISPDQVKMTDEKGTERVVHINKQTVIKTTGEATLEFLKNGLLVEFKAEIDAKGNASGKVEDLTILSPSKEHSPGVFSEGGAEAKPAPKAGAKLSLKSTPAAKEKSAAAPGGISKVVGRIKSVKGGKLQVNAGNKTVQCELSDGAKISVDMSDVNFATKGDKIEVKGTAMPNTPNQAQAQSITITLAEPLGMKKKADSTKADPKHPPKAFKPKGGSGLPAPADDR